MGTIHEQASEAISQQGFTGLQKQVVITKLCDNLKNLSTDTTKNRSLQIKFVVRLDRDETDYEIFTSSTKVGSSSRLTIVLNEKREVNMYFGNPNGPLYLQGQSIVFPNFNFSTEQDQYQDVLEFEINFVPLKGDFNDKIGVLTSLQVPLVRESEKTTFFMLDDGLVGSFDCGPEGLLGVAQSRGSAALSFTDSPYIGRDNSVQRLFALRFIALLLFIFWLILVFRKSAVVKD
jgi:hypothetical protein